MQKKTYWNLSSHKNLRIVYVVYAHVYIHVHGFFYIIVPFKLAQVIDVRGLKQVLKFVEIQTKRLSHRKVWMHVSFFCSWSST